RRVVILTYNFRKYPSNRYVVDPSGNPISAIFGRGNYHGETSRKGTNNGTLKAADVVYVGNYAFARSSLNRPHQCQTFRRYVSNPASIFDAIGKHVAPRQIDSNSAASTSFGDAISYIQRHCHHVWRNPPST